MRAETTVRSISIVLVALVYALTASVLSAQISGQPKNVPQARPIAAMSDLWTGFLPSPLVRSGYFSSYDRLGGNDDGFKGTYSSLYRLENGQHVLVDVDGPGCLYTLWFTGPTGGYAPAWGKLGFTWTVRRHRVTRRTGRRCLRVI